MSDPRTFGQAVREARLAKGMSMGQLATSVERSTASVRRWERDEGVPAKNIIDDLASVLDLSDDDLALIAAERDRPAPIPLGPTSVPVESTPTPAPATATPAPATATPAPATATPAPGTATPAPGTATPAPGTATPAPGTPTPAPGTPTPAPGTPTPAPGTPTPATPPPSKRQPIPGSSQATQAAGNRVTGVVAVTEPAPTGVKGWFAALYDSANPWLGYLRAALTIVVLIALAWLFVWALAGFFGAVAEIWDGMWAAES